MTAKEAFRKAYMIELARQHALKPEIYVWPISELPTVVDKMIAALERGGANIDSPAIKAACKVCGFKPSIQRIRDYLAKGVLV